MSRHQRASITPGLRTFISKVITPACLVLGVLFLIFYNFHSVLKVMKVTDDHFHGNVAFSQNAFAFSFQENTGIGRPVLSNAGQALLSYAEWSSTVSVDGAVQELWNNSHGYDVDESKDQIDNTISNDGWQLTEIITLVNNHTVTVTFTFDARSTARPAPTHYIFDIAHVTDSSYEWYNYQTNNTTFNAQVIQGDWKPVQGNPTVFGKLSFSTTSAAVQVNNSTVISGDRGGYNLANAFSTQYTVNTPSPFQVITLGTETLTYQPAPATPGAPL